MLHYEYISLLAYSNSAVAYRRKQTHQLFQQKMQLRKKERKGWSLGWVEIRFILLV
jgi:hypothetical protein